MLSFLPLCFCPDLTCIRGFKLPKDFAIMIRTVLPAGITLADLPQDSDDSDVAHTPVPAKGATGLSSHQAQVEGPAVRDGDSSDSGSEEAESDAAVSSGVGDENRSDRPAEEHTLLQTLAD